MQLIEEELINGDQKNEVITKGRTSVAELETLGEYSKASAMESKLDDCEACRDFNPEGTINVTQMVNLKTWAEKPTSSLFAQQLNSS